MTELKELAYFAWTPDHVLAIAAITFAVIQFFDARREKKEISRLALSMSTRFVGTFPKNINEIVDVAQCADQELLIMTDFVAYGSYSAHEQFLDFKSIVEKKRSKGVSVRIIRYSAYKGLSVLKDQFAPDNFDQVKATSNFASFRKRVQGSIEQYDEFIAALQMEETNVKEFFENSLVLIRDVEKDLPMFLWIEDAEDSLFAFRYPGSPTRGFSFRTRDGSLVKSFQQLFEQHWLEATKTKTETITPPAVTHSNVPEATR